jgi:Rha family phage regulatory protein
MSDLINTNAFTVVEGRPVTSSRIVANYFGKRHEDVVRSIRSIIAKKPELQASRNFAEWSEEVEIGSGAKRTVISFWMDRKGFSILAMGFTGAKALDFKCAFYDEFERMEAQLRSPSQLENGDTITNAQQVAIQQAVARRAKKTAVYYQTIYRAIKARYQIPRYTELKQSQFEDCLRFIETVDLSVPEAPTTTPPETEKPQRYVVYADFLNTLQVFCYYQRYLFRKPLMQAMRVMLALDVPDASKLWDAVNDLNLVKLERSLDDLGFSVKDLDCYKHWALTHTAQ